MARRRIVEEDVDDVHYHDIPYSHRIYERDSSMNDIWGLVLLVIVLILFFAYILPLIRTGFSSSTGSSGGNSNPGTQINNPGVNINPPQPTH